MRKVIDLYLKQARPILIGAGADTNFVWISSRTGKKFTIKNLGTLISKVTSRTIGVDVCPHLFRTTAATTAATFAHDTPYLASGVLGHRDRRTTELHYNRADSIAAAQVYAGLVGEYRARSS